MYRCFKSSLKTDHGFAKLCFPCDEWITSKEHWEAHCLKHIQENEIPLRCDPVIFRRGLARAGYCPCCLGDLTLPATDRMRHHKHSSGWKRHFSSCLERYLKSLPEKDLVACPHPRCTYHDLKPSLSDHLKRSHGKSKLNVVKKRRNQSAEENGSEASSKVSKRRRLCRTTKRRTISSSLPSVADKSHSSHGDDLSTWDNCDGHTSDETILLSPPQASSDFESVLTTTVSKPIPSALREESLNIIPVPNPASKPLVEPSACVPFTDLSTKSDLPLETDMMEGDVGGDSESEYEVEKILKTKMFGRQQRYWVKWKGYPSSQNTWEPLTNLQNCLEKLAEFQSRC